MTLILTELSHYDIAMAIDSDFTETPLKPDGTISYKDYYGARKQFVVPKLNTIISYREGSDIPQPEFSWQDEKKSYLEQNYGCLVFLESNKKNYHTISELPIFLKKN